MKITKILCVLALFFASNANATRYYVNNTATGNQNGLSWTNAFTDLQTALSLVVFGDEIWVAAGQYKPTTTTDRTISFVLKNGVNLFGGFAGTETTLAERDLANNPTTLNGDIGQPGEVSDNTYSILRGTNITSAIEVNGFRIINGNCSSGSQRGGGLNFTSSMNGLITLKKCYFFSNNAQSYGGAIYLRSSKMLIDSCEFRNNTTNGGNGGAIYTLNDAGNSFLQITNSKFIGNVSRIGACIANTSSYDELNFEGCVFTNNQSDISIIEIDGFNQAKILNSYIIGNTVDDFSPRLLYVSNSFGGVDDEFQLINCTIANNFNVTTSTVQSELIKLNGLACKVRNCIIYGNSMYQGRQLKLGSTISDCLIQGGYMNGVNIIDADPDFVNPGMSVNSNFDASAFDYSLQQTSPAVNAGNNSYVAITNLLDINQTDRIQGCLVDLGCYESPYAHTFNEVDSITACDTYTWIDGNTYTENNSTSFITLQSQLGCDSLLVLNLILNQSTSSIDNISTCGTYTWMDGITYTESNQIATFTLVNSAGCDSTITLNLTIDPIHLPSVGIDQITSCDSYTWIDGITYTANNNTATYVLQNAGGCDSTVTLDLTITSSNTGVETVSSCEPYTWINGVTYQTSTNTAQHVLQNANGCDSTVTLNLTILNPTLNLGVTSNGASLTSLEQNASYKWINCANPSVILSTNQQFVASENGTYAVILTSEICPDRVDTSACFVVDFTNLSSSSAIAVQIFPTPSESSVFIQSDVVLQKVNLTNALGKIIESKEPIGKEASFNLQHVSSGTFFIELIDEQGNRMIYKHIKN